MHGGHETLARKRSTSLSLELAVLAYLDKLAEEQDRTRSQMVNFVVKQFAAQNGVSIAPVRAQPQRAQSHADV